MGQYKYVIYAIDSSYRKYYQTIYRKIKLSTLQADKLSGKFADKLASKYNRIYGCNEV